MVHWYGFANAYGNGSRMDGSRVGRVHVFDSRRERDEWVDADRFEGEWHREEIGSSEALRIMAGGLAPWMDIEGMGTDELVEAYCSWHRQ